MVLALSVLITSAFSVTAFAADKGKITVSSANAKAGDTVDITVSMTQNPGIATADFEVKFDTAALTLAKVKDEGFISENDAQNAGQAHSDQLVSPYHFSWCNDLAKANITKTGKMVTMSFKVSEKAKDGTYNITVDAKNVEIYDKDIKDVGFEFVNGAITVGSTGKTFLVGDVNGNGVVNSADFTILSRYVSGWSGYADKIKNMDAADLNQNGTVNSADFTILSRYVSGWTGYDKYIKTVTK